MRQIFTIVFRRLIHTHLHFQSLTSFQFRYMIFHYFSLERFAWPANKQLQTTFILRSGNCSSCFLQTISVVATNSCKTARPAILEGNIDFCIVMEHASCTANAWPTRSLRGLEGVIKPPRDSIATDVFCGQRSNFSLEASDITFAQEVLCCVNNITCDVV